MQKQVAVVGRVSLKVVSHEIDELLVVSIFSLFSFFRSLRLQKVSHPCPVIGHHVYAPEVSLREHGLASGGGGEGRPITIVYARDHQQDKPVDIRFERVVRAEVSKGAGSGPLRIIVITNGGHYLRCSVRPRVSRPLVSQVRIHR